MLWIIKRKHILMGSAGSSVRWVGFIIVIGVLLTVDNLISGLIGVVFGMFFIAKYSPKGSSRPIYKRKWPFVVSLFWVLSAFANLTAPDVPGNHLAVNRL